jgi:hypothetical protein
MALWLKYMGFGKYAATFMDNYFEICFLNRLKESHLERVCLCHSLICSHGLRLTDEIQIGIAPEDRAPIFEIIKQYSEFSSVEGNVSRILSPATCI